MLFVVERCATTNTLVFEDIFNEKAPSKKKKKKEKENKHSKATGMQGRLMRMDFV